MEITIGMTRKGLVKFANEILANCLESETNGSDSVKQVTRYIPANGRGPELTLNLDNQDMEGDDRSDDESYYEQED